MEGAWSQHGGGGGKGGWRAAGGARGRCSVQHPVLAVGGGG
jgi:hypothetical protein